MTIQKLLDVEKMLAAPGSMKDYGGHHTMDWMRAALRALLEAELRREQRTPSAAEIGAEVRRRGLAGP